MPPVSTTYRLFILFLAPFFSFSIVFWVFFFCSFLLTALYRCFACPLSFSLIFCVCWCCVVVAFSSACNFVEFKEQWPSYREGYLLNARSAPTLLNFYYSNDLNRQRWCIIVVPYCTMIIIFTLFYFILFYNILKIKYKQVFRYATVVFNQNNYISFYNLYISFSIKASLFNNKFYDSICCAWLS